MSQKRLKLPRDAKTNGWETLPRDFGFPQACRIIREAQGFVRKVMMANAIEELEKKLPLLAEDEKRELTFQVQRLIDLIMKDVRMSARHLEGRTSLYREAWSLIGERRRLLLRDLERIRAMLA